MRDPQFYATALKNAVEQMEIDDVDKGAAMSLARRWQALSSEAGRLKLETWKLLGPCFPEPQPRHPAFARLLDDMRRNDVT